MNTTDHTAARRAMRRARASLAHAVSLGADAKTAKAERRAARRARGFRQQWREAAYLAEMAEAGE